jgi:hypothetical protein
MIVELDVDVPSTPASTVSYLRERAELELRMLREEKEVGSARRVPSPTIRMAATGVAELEYELQLRGKTLHELVLVKRQGDLYVLARVLAEPRRLADYREVLREVATSMRYLGGG